MKYDDHPFIAIWEITQACDLVCQHCRACAQPARDAQELSTQEGFALLRRFAEAKVPLVVLTGGDPAKRPDLVELVRYGVSLGLHLGLTPSATPLVTENLLEQLVAAGLKRLAVSIDGPDAITHDAFRGVQGSFDQAARILSTCERLDLRTQINTSVHNGNIARLPEMAELVKSLRSVLWSVFYVVPTGRAEASMLPSAEAVEQSLLDLATIAESAPFALKTTAAPHYRRVLAERQKLTGSRPDYGVMGKLGERVNDGRGFLFVSHRGEIYPSGFLPLGCGNVRHSDPITVYREHPLFRGLRDADRFTGKCGVCVYRNLCGGSRARAFALNGSPYASDPLCAYVPPGYVETEANAPRRLALV
ncbi:MAG: TIGR04053 family radical SAM/SPASM domain-containing protein [Myxococcota bacterium]